MRRGRKEGCVWTGSVIVIRRLIVIVACSLGVNVGRRHDEMWKESS